MVPFKIMITVVTMWQVLMAFIPEDYDHVCVITVCKRLPCSLVDCIKSSFSSACFIKNERPKANTWGCLSVPLRWRTIPLPFFSAALIMWRNWRCHFEFIMSIKLKRNGLFWGFVCLFVRIHSCILLFLIQSVSI